ncbi:MAG: hypothetical protein ACI4EJ_10960 [Bacteroides sp.]
MQTIRKFSVKKVIGMTVFLLLVIFYIARVVVVNARYDKPQIITYEKGEICEYKDFSFCMKTKEFLTPAQMRERYGSSKIDGYVGDSVKKDDLFMIVGFDAAYHGDKDETRVPLTKIQFQSGAWTNGEDYYLIDVVNPDGVSVRRNETKRIYLATYAGKITFARKNWSTIRDRKYNMVLETYPDVIRMRCE